MRLFLPISLFDGICTQANINTNVNLKNKNKTIFDYLYIEIQSSHSRQLEPKPTSSRSANTLSVSPWLLLGPTRICYSRRSPQ